MTSSLAAKYFLRTFSEFLFTITTKYKYIIASGTNDQLVIHLFRKKFPKDTTCNKLMKEDFKTLDKIIYEFLSAV